MKKFFYGLIESLELYNEKHRIITKGDVAIVVYNNKDIHVTSNIIKVYPGKFFNYNFDRDRDISFIFIIQLKVSFKLLNDIYFIILLLSYLKNFSKILLVKKLTLSIGSFLGL